MKKLLTYGLILCSTLSFGWGQTGHRVVGEVAYRHMTPAAKERVLAILEGESPAMVSTWMDFIKSDSEWDHMRAWHYVTIPDSCSYEEIGAPEEGDAYTAINRIIREIQSGEFEGWTEAEALKSLIHLVGDVHQPLHVGNGEDRGGNDVKVKWFGKSSNLHRVWDTELIDGQQLSYTEYADWIDVASPDQISKWQADEIMVWLNESKAMRESVYDIDDPDRMGYRYNFDHIDEVNERLLQAGIRLAGILNELYG
ncbi:S1/P1 nuclease [Phaeocystidibacter luteus]|uniref:S1/P1 nuclease n=1 Tax=Phaeocystidibacter luteus TaxID=911197 RepID=A0A6N6RIX3_9FLAO|nr:S1/P1 nuclease [Phaeocystidibacter luteus]KAB2814252.1 S1/P1 nuclease [Phaeocystidibacter luteus]